MWTRPNYLVSVSSHQKQLFADLFCQISARSTNHREEPRCKTESRKFFMGGFKAIRKDEEG